jgi:hydrogenase small subunit
MGCKGPVTYQNCPTVRWNGATNWPIGCGHPCIGCAEPAFWDVMTPFYQHLQPIPGFNVGSNVDMIGLGATAAVAATFAGHGVISAVRNRKEQQRRIAVDALDDVHDTDIPEDRKGGVA